ncbi:hypothetical protein SAMN05444349_11880 [Bacteroides faecichinchillae]|uniref:Uncharacterized protein n=1 Tax=Bacteroides faecichinchillae TaxID=871325 RepID=A0A1M5BDV5_9BACE|nr:hypothetical protein [Bacteroides faecichinchillae]SHF40636.1 hypothetical protein SAMN05444349_11880 [Bacteroides faecichinchillae]
MACIKKVSQNLAFDCQNPGLISGINGIEEAVIINFEDVATLTSSQQTGEANITLKKGTRGYTIQCVKNSCQETEAIKINDNAPTMMEISMIIKILSSLPVVSYIIAALSGTFLVAVRTKTNQYFLLGVHAQLEASDFSTDSATDGVSVITLKTPDNSCGDYRYSITVDQYNSLKNVN